MPSAMVTIPFIEGMKSAAGYTYDYTVNNCDPDYMNGRMFGDRALQPSSGFTPAERVQLQDAVAAVAEMKKQMEMHVLTITKLIDVVEKAQNEILDLKDEIRAKDDRWGKF